MFGVTGSFPVTLPLAQIVKGLNEFQPTDLFSYTLMLRRLAEEMQLGRLWVSPSYLNCAGEPLTAETRAEIEDTFRCPLSNIYAATEVGIIARRTRDEDARHQCCQPRASAHPLRTI